MQYSVPDISYHIYDKTFLLLVKFRLNYSVNYNDPEVFRIFKQYFYDNFGLDLDEAKFEMMRYSGIKVSDKNAGISFNFRNGYIRIEIEGGLYRSYTDTLLPLILPVKLLLQEIKADIERLSIQKINGWDFDQKSDIFDLMQKIFIRELTSNWKDPKCSDEHGGISTILTHPNNDAEKIILSFGYVRDVDGHNRIVLDSEGICDTTTSLTPSTIEKVAQTVNKNLYNLYHWAVNSQVIESMTYPVAGD